jgi:flagellar biosynthesis protein FliQ
MDTTLVVTALGVVCQISLVLFAAALVGAICAGILRVATQIDDAVIGLSGKIAAVAVLFYVSGGYFQGQLFSFAQNVWSSSNYYF